MAGMARNFVVRSYLAGGVRANYYEVLSLPKTATPGQIKTAYRKLALQHHPDVSDSPDSQHKFVELSRAYEVLIDEETRASYDLHGEKFLNSRTSKVKNAAQAFWKESWDEFKPIERTTRRGDARVSAAAKIGRLSIEDGGEVNGVTQAQVGDVVEYRLSDAIKGQHQDGREKGVGLVVGRNIDRGDREKLPLKFLDLVEIEPLYKERDSEEWRTDPMESPAFDHLSSLRILHADYEKVADYWRIYDELSNNCGSPDYAEEVIL